MNKIKLTKQGSYKLQLICQLQGVPLNMAVESRPKSSEKLSIHKVSLTFKLCIKKTSQCKAYYSNVTNSNVPIHVHLCNLIVQTIVISNLNYLTKPNSFEISKVYNIWLQRHRDLKIRVCGKDSISLRRTLKLQLLLNLGCKCTYSLINSQL